jgi:HK97 gp10 family phage protein
VTMFLESRIPEIVAEMKAKAVEAERHAAQTWAQEAQARAPVASGELASSVHVEGENEVVVDAVNVDGEPYGIYVELGTSTHGAQPFFRPAEDLARARMEADLLAEFRAL